MTEYEKKHYFGIHHWLRDTFGKANHCENPNCRHKSKRFEYAKIRGLLYEYKRENFIQLCKPCHAKYDDTFHDENWNKKVSLGLTGKKLSEDHKKKVSKPEDWTKERKTNISNGLLKFYKTHKVQRTKKWKSNISKGLKNSQKLKDSFTPERRKTISESLKKYFQSKRRGDLQK